MLLAVACTALGCDECERACDEDYQECIAESSREDCGDERTVCENTCRAEDAQTWDVENTSSY
jgi:hypothetical protein